MLLLDPAKPWCILRAVKIINKFFSEHDETTPTLGEITARLGTIEAQQKLILEKLEGK